jgi:ribonuclease HII
MGLDQCPSLFCPETVERSGDTYSLERHLAGLGYCRIAGVDEAGRGPLAGPVVAGCVILPEKCDHSLFKDSKKLTARQRDASYDILMELDAATGVGICSPRKIEEINILQASLLAMKLAVQDCLGSGLPDFLLVDGTFPVPLAIPQQSLTKGESRSASIAAASIIAKVTRDRIMARAHQQYPQYNFLANQGYPTREHRLAIAEHGPCDLHRRTFKGVREFCPRQGERAALPDQQSLWEQQGKRG